MRAAWLLLWLAGVAAAQPAGPAVDATATDARAASPAAPVADEAGLTARLAKIREDLVAAERERAQRADAVQRSLQELRTVEGEIATRNRTLRQLAAESAEADARLTELLAERARQETRLSAQKASLAALLRSTYALGRLDTLKLVLAQDQLADTGRLLAYQQQLQRTRVDRIGSVNRLLQSLAALQQETLLARAALEQARAAETEQLAALQEVRQRRARVLAQLRQALAQSQARVDALESDRADLEGLLAQLREVIGDVPALLPEDRPFAELRGRLPRPLAGRVLLGFGQQHLGRASAGVRIEAARGAQIRAVARGRVAFADWLRGYGQLLILDHGDGYMSLYGRCESLLASEGEWVEAGAVVALAGDSGGAASTGLYFELRQNGQALDPATWWRP
ncbi:MAG: peptidoglycan DD-metalloendopeptidase family protein [Xanthomonadales bacterium]|nr:Murein hydrolase activator EnvC [Xanthomonadales bacterium]MCC6593291.1 peptidoglycan DD-metalloendopeptidase family protein [Xanthomonadales bacterium]MCE7930500.1 peptidase M23 [Xanthomonadales bacterium PRO6]